MEGLTFFLLLPLPLIHDEKGPIKKERGESMGVGLTQAHIALPLHNGVGEMVVEIKGQGFLP